MMISHVFVGYHYPDNKVHGANMGPIWGRQDPDVPHVGPMKLAIWAKFNGGLANFPSKLGKE